jgi:hypothetical protein
MAVEGTGSGSSGAKKGDSFKKWEGQPGRSFWELKEECIQEEIRRRFKNQRAATAYDSMQYYGTMIAPQTKGQRYHQEVVAELRLDAFRSEDGEFVDPSPRYPAGLEHIRRNLAAGARQQAATALAASAAGGSAAEELDRVEAIVLALEVVALGSQEPADYGKLADPVRSLDAMRLSGEEQAVPYSISATGGVCGSAGNSQGSSTCKTASRMGTKVQRVRDFHKP